MYTTFDAKDSKRVEKTAKKRKNKAMFFVVAQHCTMWLIFAAVMLCHVLLLNFCTILLFIVAGT